MATNSTDIYSCVLPIEQFGTCPACSREFEDPVWLKCCHTVCRGCLTEGVGFEKVLCPVCKTATLTNEQGKNGLLVDTFARKIAQLSKLKKSKPNLNRIKCTAECMQVNYTST